jgi:hypothetical protein
MKDNGSVFVFRERCPGCKGVTFDTIYSTKYSNPQIHDYLKRHYGGSCDLDRVANETYDLCRCRACALIFQRGIPGDALLAEIYDEWIGAEARQQLAVRNTLEHYRSLSSQVQTIIQQSGKPPHMIRVLDFGMGWCVWLNMARAFGCQGFGAELSTERIAYAHTIGVPVINFGEIPGQDFDSINAEQVFEHLADPLQTLHHLASGLSRSGTIRISVPDSRHAPKIISTRTKGELPPRDALMEIAPLEHINSFHSASLRAMAREAGLIERTPRFAHLYNAASGWFSVRGAVKNVLRPIYHHVYPKTTIAFFGRS